MIRSRSRRNQRPRRVTRQRAPHHHGDETLRMLVRVLARQDARTLRARGCDRATATTRGDTALKVAINARYSSDNQRDASIADQLRVCREFAARQGWTVVHEFTDHAVSGATLLRSGFQALMRDALNRRFDVVIAEALDRFSRDQEDTAGLFKRLTFAGVDIVTLAEGDITHLHVGLKGTMNALFLKDLAEKTRRGLRGRVELGKSGGGLCYGYKVARATAGGASVAGSREIVVTEAEVIRRIFRDYAAGLSPKAIAKRLNVERCPGPGSAPWNPSTIHGNPARGTGILNNELYVGRLVSNRLRYVKDPDTGKRVSRPNAPSEWVTAHVPELRIVDDELWNLVKARQVEMRRVALNGDPKRFNQARLDERRLSRPAVTDDGDVADLGGLGHGRSVFLRASTSGREA
jgi:site-specific DNA recombinase